jgi:stage III sporulation protein AE
MRCAAAACAAALLLACPLPAHADSTLSRQTQPYLDEAPITLSDFLRAPAAALKTLLADKLTTPLRQILQLYGRVVLFLVLCAAVVLAVPGDGWQDLLELVCAGGCFLMLSAALLRLVQNTAAQAQGWQAFLTSFLPVFAAATVAAGQATSAAVCTGLLLTGLSALSGLLQRVLVPGLSAFLALNAAAVFSGSASLGTACTALGRLLRRMAAAAGAAFTALLGLQRIFAASADSTAWRLGKAAMEAAVPIVGQTVTAAADTVLSAAETLRTGLAFAALATLAADFLPLYLSILLHLLLLEVCALTARLLGLEKSGEMLAGIAAGLEVAAALLALFFGMACVGTVLMIAYGNGGG